MTRAFFPARTVASGPGCLRHLVDLGNNVALRVINIIAVDAAGMPRNKQYRYVMPITVDFGVTVSF